MNINDYLAALRFRGNDWTRIPAESLIHSLLFTSLTRLFLGEFLFQKYPSDRESDAVIF